jgi:hypothetical protein
MSTAAKRPAAPRPGDHMLYRSFDHYGTGAERDQLVLVTGVSGDGKTVHGKPLCWTDEGAVFDAAALRPVGDGDGDSREGG